jgi:hypothetical protein
VVRTEDLRVVAIQDLDAEFSRRTGRAVVGTEVHW